ncbi:zinc finger protein OZF-like [Varroa jacobsoni]|uniref:C2H2-type domain-containing protein n=1 Tax=Varroa destructor TaxID=109461 RepID=A0A7M7J8W5_VARDE|nr:zinc finger protein OZF-like [Varroa destructor]XP_022648473.1 zinc finger protein OZF-like [Varroa destructor]XP_022693153.1 zinc finger protein OZF-like [Varroa jacobsoni]XP_022693154.1 zinc finger protein OZF-like [Varroa jacobsoni]
MELQEKSVARRVTAVDKRLMGRLALKYQVDLRYVLAVLKVTKWDAGKAELEIQNGEECRHLVETMAQEFNRDSAEVRKLLDSVSWNTMEARKFAQQHRSWRIPEASKAKERDIKNAEAQQNPENEKKKFACTFCPMSFNRLRFFEVHVKAHDGPKPFKCQSCGFAFGAEEHLSAHIQAHIDKSYACDLCSGRFSRREHLIRHLAIHARSSKKHMKQHIKNRIKEISKNKDNAFTYKGSIKKAISIANKGIGLKCRICSRTFTTKTWLTRHMKDTHDDIPFQCNICDQIFADRDILEAHVKSHGKQRFRCTFCSSAFLRKDHLQRHMNSHTGERNFACDVCDKTFIQKAHLNEHKRSKHGEVTGQ